VGARTEVYVAATKSADFGVAQASLADNEEQCVITSTYPCGQVRRGGERRGLLFGKELDRAAVVALIRDRQHPLALQRVGRLRVGNESKERTERGEAGVAGLRLVGAPALEVIKKAAEELRVEI